MDKLFFLILPNQLFDITYFDKKFIYIIWECPHYFIDYNYNKKKLILHRASMRYQYDIMKQKGYNITYIEFNKKLPENQKYTLYYPINKLEILKLPKNTIIYEKNTPNLLLSNDLIEKYRKKTDKFFFNAFYMWSKKELNIIPNIKSQDKLNRQKPSKDFCVSQPYDTINKNLDILKYIEEAKLYVEKYFKNNCGNTKSLFIYPISRKDTLKWLEHFIENKLKNFGNYQDFIDKNNKHMCHSLLSALINIGLINPIDIIEILEKHRKTKNIPINSYEGFIRQLFWREYQHLCYLYVDFSENYFGNNKKLTNEWYTGKTGILPVDDSICEAFETGYLHHIKRLMVIGNYMNLNNIKPSEGFRWFMEFSCDSYEWVMYQNVYDMVFFVTGGKTMRRPYISSSNYILNMSNYSKDKWCEIWNDKYKDFIQKNRKNLWKYRYYVALK
jgi:deoxyribodipyrimidine photolyase-related protein